MAELVLDPTERGRGLRWDRDEEEACRGVGEKAGSLREAVGGDAGTGESVSAVDRDVLLVSNERCGSSKPCAIGTLPESWDMSSEGDSLMFRLGRRKGLPPRLGGNNEELLPVKVPDGAESRAESYHVVGRVSTFCCSR
jgi:hypothetical protein